MTTIIDQLRRIIAVIRKCRTVLVTRLKITANLLLLIGENSIFLYYKDVKCLIDEQNFEESLYPMDIYDEFLDEFSETYPLLLKTTDLTVIHEHFLAATGGKKLAYIKI